MSNPAQFRGARKGLRDAFQAVLAVLAAGGATVAFEALITNLDPVYSALMAVAFKILIAYAQNYLETSGKIGVLLPTPGLIPVAVAVDAIVAPVAGAVEAVADAAGDVTGVVTDVTGGVVGKVVGKVKGIRRGAAAKGKGKDA